MPHPAWILRFIYVTFVAYYQMTPYTAPNVSQGDVTTQLVRDELLRCFESANREFANLLNQPVTDTALKSQVNQFVTTVFANCGVSFENPTKEGIIAAVAQCKNNAEAMMGPKGSDIIEHHYFEMMKLIDKLP